MTNSTIADTIDVIQSVNRQITGVTKAPALAAYPLKCDTADAPLCLTWPGEAVWSRQGFGGKKRTDRTYRVIVFVAPLGQNEFPSRAEETAILLSRFEDTWLNPAATPLQDPSVAGDRQVTIEFDGSFPNDDGVSPNLQIGGVAWSGFEIRLRVRELW